MSQPQTNSKAQSRLIGSRDVFALGLNGVVGSGIFFLPSVGDKLLGPAAVVATIIAGLLAWLIASAFSVVSSDYQRNGGAYVYARDQFGRYVGFHVGWMTWFVAVTSWGALLNALFLAVEGLFPAFADTALRNTGMVVLVGALTLLNIRGLQWGAWVSTILTVLKVAPLILLALAGWTEVSFDHVSHFAPRGWSGLGDATLLILYAYVGFESLVVPAAEIKGSRALLPRVLPILIAFVAVLYSALQVICIGTLDGLAERANPISDSASVVFGEGVGALFVTVSIISVLGVNAGAARVQPRRLSALAAEGDAPRLLGRIHPVYQTPYIAVVVTAVAALGFGLSGSFKELALLSVVARFVQYLPTCWVAFRKAGQEPVRHSVRLKSLVAIVVSVALLFNADPAKLIAGLAGLVVLSVVYALRELRVRQSG
mgnify:CR=1 FL=1